MLRTFATHKIRKQEELSSCLWDFTTLQEEGESVRLKVAVPSTPEKVKWSEEYQAQALEKQLRPS